MLGDGMYREPWDSTRLGVGRILLRVLLVVATAVVGVGITLAIVCFLVFRGPSGSARDLVVQTLYESGTLTALPGVFLTDAQITDIFSRSRLDPVEEGEIDASLVDTSAGAGYSTVELVEIERPTFDARLLIVADPSRMHVATVPTFGERGATLLALVEDTGAVAGLSGGALDASRGSGGYPTGTVVSGGRIVWNDTSMSGLYLVGFDEDGLLVIKDIRGKSDYEVQQLVEAWHIREAVCVVDESEGTSVSFGPLIKNGVARTAGGTGSGQRARAAIGQRADGAVLMLACDGDVFAGKPGATASDLISIMAEYGAVNAVNLASGKAAELVAEGSWQVPDKVAPADVEARLIPTAFVVEAR